MTGDTLRQRLVRLGKNIALGVAGIAALLLVLTLGAICQFGQGQVRPYLPPIVRSLLTNPEDQAVVDEYLHDVDSVLGRLSEKTEACQVAREQRCLTSAFEEAWNGVGDGVPVEASWMGGAHGRLRDALHTMWQVHLRSETEPMTDQFVGEATAATEEFIASVDEWYRQAER